MESTSEEILRMKGAAAIFRFLREAADHGRRTVLVTITAVVGTSSREIGHHMAIDETGAYLGSLSGGCVEAAVVGEALRILEDGSAKTLRFGAGSPLIDIRLPCGGGLDLHFLPDPSPVALADALLRLDGRRPVWMGIDFGAGSLFLEHDGAVEPVETIFTCRHDPDLHLSIFGNGEETVALARLARAYGATVHVSSPDRDILHAISAFGATGDQLTSLSDPPVMIDDPYGAAIVLFHDHDWDIPILSKLLRQQTLFIGAMGSHRTHESRLEGLRALGFSAAALNEIVSPIGLIPSTRDPDTLALSVLAQVVERYKLATSHRPRRSEIIQGASSIFDRI